MPATPETINRDVELIEIKEVKKIEQVKTPEQIVIDVFGKNSDMYLIANCESGFNTYVVGDGHLICKRTGLPIRSRGIWQINDCAHPEVSDAQAFDPIWSTNWAKKKEWNKQNEWKRCYELATKK